MVQGHECFFHGLFTRLSSSLKGVAGNRPVDKVHVAYGTGGGYMWRIAVLKPCMVNEFTFTF